MVTDDPEASSQHADIDGVLADDDDERPSILSVPTNVLHCHMAEHLDLREFEALRPTSHAFRTVTALAVSETAQSARLHLHNGVSSGEAHALGAALGSTLSQCQQPKHLCVSITSADNAHSTACALDGIDQSGASQHVAALHLDRLTPHVPAIPDQLHNWPWLRSLEVTSILDLEPGLGSSMAQLTQLQSLGLKLQVPDRGGHIGDDNTLNASHMQQLTQLTSLSLEVSTGRDVGRDSTLSAHQASALVGSVSAMPLLRSFELRCSGRSDAQVTAALSAALPALHALTSLNYDLKSSANLTLNLCNNLLRAISALPSLQHLGLPNSFSITHCAILLTGLTTLSSLRLHTGLVEEQDDARVTQLLSRLTRLEVVAWHWHHHLRQHGATWLAHLEEVAVGCVHLPVIAALPPNIRIVGRGGVLNIKYRPGVTESEVCDATSRLLSSPAVTRGRSVLDVGGLQLRHTAAIKPLAEAVSCVRGLKPTLVHHMAGWQLRGMSVDASSMASRLPELAQSLVQVEGLSVEVLELYCVPLSSQEHMEEVTTAIVQLCQGLQGLRQVVLKPFTVAALWAAIQGEMQETQVAAQHEQLVQQLQQAVQGRGVQVLLC